MIINVLSTLDENILLQAIIEGYVIISIIKLLLVGPPAVGKRSLKHLLFNWDPPHHHHNTAIADRPIRAVERVAKLDGAKTWEIVTTEDLMQMLAEDIRVQASLNTIEVPPQNILEIEDGSVQPVIDFGSAVQTFGSDIVDHKQATKGSILELSKDILSAMEGSASQQLSNSTWVYALDSGGQPHFADISRPFGCGNTVILIVHKLTDQLSSKPIFQYSIDGKPLTQPNELRMTNLELITTYVRSISSAKFGDVDGDIEALPTFIIIGTYEDQMGGWRSLFQESLKQKNAILISALHQYKHQLIFYNEFKEELIFPVYNMCHQNREALSSRIRTHVFGHKKAVIMKEIPICWYILESNIKEEGRKSYHGIVSQAYCHEIGQMLGMTNAQIRGAIAFFRSLSVFLHFNTCSYLIFTNPQYILDALSNIIRISFVDFPEMLLMKGKILPPNAHHRLRQEGLFTIDLLDLVSIQFVPGLFEKVDLLRLLCDLYIVAEVHRDESTYYFMPIVLSPKHLTANEKRKFAITCEPLVLYFRYEVVPQVRTI